MNHFQQTLESLQNSPKSWLITGVGGFIGSNLLEALLKLNQKVVGIDNFSTGRKNNLIEVKALLEVNRWKNFTFYEGDITLIDDCMKVTEGVDFVLHQAALGSVPRSVEDPITSNRSNIDGFLNILEGCRHSKVKHLVYASSSSVYGTNTKIPFSTDDTVDHPIRLYAATKKSNELMAHSYSHIYGLPTTGLRFFTVYGPWGRPDMALFLFTKSIIEGKTIQVNNYGKHQRDFTYVDDIVEGLVRVIDQPAKSNSNWDSFNPSPSSSNAPWKIYNIGNGKPIELMKYIAAIEESLKIKANIKYAPLQKGDVIATYADTSHLNNDMEYKPKTSIDDGVRFFVDWYKDFYDLS